MWLLKEFLIENGEESGIINLGGNIQSIGIKPDGTEYQFGIQYPFKQQGEVIEVVSVSDSSMVSSGIYERYFKIDDFLFAFKLMFIYNIIKLHNGGV